VSEKWWSGKFLKASTAYRGPIFAADEILNRPWFWPDNKPEGEAGGQTAQVGGHAHFGRENVEQDLDPDDEENVHEPLSRLPGVTMPH
jgi:hypothetical protein